MRRSFIVCAFAAALGLVPAGAAHAQQFPIPGKPIRIIVPFAAGGQTDIQARAIAQRMAETLPVSVIVENKPGASTLLGAREVQKSAPDGHTLLYTIATHVQMPHLYKVPPWNVFTDFTPITTGARSATVLTAHISAPFNTVPELVAYAKANPGKLNYASFGAGSSSHLNGEMLRLMAEIELVHVPYKGSGDAMKDHLAGEVQLFFDGPTTAIANQQTGRVKFIATAAETRKAALPMCRPCASKATTSAPGAISGSGARPACLRRSSISFTVTWSRRSSIPTRRSCSPRAARRHRASRRPRWRAR